MADDKKMLPISSQLAMTPISKFMSKKVINASVSTTVRHAMEMMLNNKISGLVVTDENLMVLGVYSELDAMLQGSSQNLDAHIHFTKPALCVKENSAFRDVLLLIAAKKIKRFPVVDSHNRLSGIVTRRDLMKAIFKDIANVRS